jgi:hypothetical protein
MDTMKSLFLGLCVSHNLVPDEANDSVLWIPRKISNEFELFISADTHQSE